jgi:serine-type D-Ala-D-Ala endopeptidase (penicillin-binding protein 7)
MLALALGTTPLAQAQSKTAAKASKPAAAAATSKAAKATKAKVSSARATRAAAPARRKAAVRKSVVRLQPASPSFGHLYGLQKAEDELDLKSSVALVVDQDTNEVLFSKNPGAVLPIASITKLMTALVVIEAGLSLDEALVVNQDDVNATVGSRSRLRVGTQLSRGEMLHLALMSSENRAAHVLGRTYPGGIGSFMVAMNTRAQLLGMSGTRYVEPTGLSPDNQSTAEDLTRLVRAASVHPLIRDLSTSPEASVPVGARQMQFRNTNGLVRNPEWEIGLQKTGYISAAGRCLVMQTQLAGRKLIMVLLDSAGKYSRMGDAERIRKWLASAPFVPSAVAAPVLVPAAAVPAAPAPVAAPVLPVVPAAAPAAAPAATTPAAPAAPAPGAEKLLLGPLMAPVVLPPLAVPAAP